MRQLCTRCSFVVTPSNADRGLVHSMKMPFDAQDFASPSGYLLLDGPPNQPDQMPRITLFFDALARAAHYTRTVFLREVRITYLHELGHYFGWNEEQIANAGLA